MTRRLAAGFWNLRVNRDPDQVRREVQALVDSEGLDWLAVAEAWQYAGALSRVVGFDYHTTRNRRPGHRDAGHLVRHGVKVTGYRLARTGTGWPRRKARGLHWARTFPHLVLDGWVRGVSVHWPPGQDRPANQPALRVCWARLVVLLTARRRRFVAVGDYNATRRSRGLFTPRTLARITGGRITGDGIDHVLARGVRVDHFRRGPARGSDHRPILFTLEER